MTDKEPEALRLAKIIDEGSRNAYGRQAAAELRRLHEVNAELVEALNDIEKNYPSLWAGERARDAIAKAQGVFND